MFCFILFYFLLSGGEIITFSYCKAETKEIALFLKMLSEDRIAQ